MWKLFLEFDQSLFFWLNAQGAKSLDPLVAGFSYIGRSQIFLAVLIPLILLFSSKQRWVKAGGVVLLTFMTHASVSFLKLLFARDRPFVTFENEVASGTLRFIDLFASPASPAFPSGHAALAFAAAVYLHRVYGPKLRWMYVWAAAMGLSRIYLGVHYPGDILMGALFGSMLGWFVVEGLHKFAPDIRYRTS